MLNRIYAGIERENRAVEVGNKVAPGTPLLVQGRPAITITGSGDYDAQEGTINVPASGGLAAVEMKFGHNRGGESLRDDYASVAFTGTYGLPVAGASVSTTEGATVYITGAGNLTLTAGSNTKYGVVEFFRGEQSATDVAVTIGINLG